MRNLDTISMSLGAIVSNKLRSILTLVGIVAGVASIIAVMTAIARRSVHDGEGDERPRRSGLPGPEMACGGFGGEEAHRKAMKRPPITIENANAIREQVKTVDLVGCELWEFGFVAQYKNEKTNPNVSICGGTPEYPPNNTHYVGLGRNISQLDVQAGRKVAVIGYAIAEKLFPHIDPVGRQIRVDGRKYEVVGVFDQKKSAFGGGFDNYVLIPISTFVGTYGMINRDGFPRSVNITVRRRPRSFSATRRRRPAR